MRIAGFFALVFTSAGCTGNITVPGEHASQGHSAGIAGWSSTAGSAGVGGAASMSGAGSAGSSAGGTTSGGAASGGTSQTGGGGIGPSACGDGLTSRRVRRLSWREYANVVGELLGDAARVETLRTLPAEPRLGGFDNQDSALRVIGGTAEILSDLAASLAAGVDVVAISGCPEPNGSASCLDAFIREFSKRAYGRPPSEEEVTRIAGVAALGEDFPASVRLVVELVLQSPHFIYVSELGSPDAPALSGAPVKLTSFEVASQLSFLLTGRRPDATLLDRAATSDLATPEAARIEAERLLQATGGLGELARFLTGWLDMAPIAEAPKSPEFFPELTPSLVSAMQEEFDVFIESALAGGAGTLNDLLTLRSVSVPPSLLPVYGSDYVAGMGLDPSRRAGVLSLPGVLSYHAARDHSGPVERGLFVRRQLLCMDVDSPPPEAVQQIADNPIDPLDRSVTTRQKFEAHVTDPSCMGCHLQFDPIGYGLEQMDGIGRFRTTENDLPVDSRGELLDTDIDGPFEGVVELSQKLATSEMFARCLVSHYFRFANARSAAASDQCVVDEWSRSFGQTGRLLAELALISAGHPTFTTRQDDR
jgi:hypothetical protein